MACGRDKERASACRYPGPLGDLVGERADVAQSTAPLQRTEAEWMQSLPGPQFSVLRKEATERPFSSALNDEKRAGVFVCAGCTLPLFTSQMPEFGQRNGVAELFHQHSGTPGHQAGLSAHRAANRISLCAMWRPSGPCVRRRAATHRRTLVQQWPGAEVHSNDREGVRRARVRGRRAPWPAIAAWRAQARSPAQRIRVVALALTWLLAPISREPRASSVRSVRRGLL